MSARTVLCVLAVVLSACSADVSSGPSGVAEQPLGRILSDGAGAGGDAGFERALEPRPFRFPDDHGPHPGYRSEWWYLTGNLTDETGRHFGFQVTFFRFALAPSPPSRDSRWATNQLYMAHAALTDTAARRFRSAERFGRGALGLAGATAAPFRVWLDDWQLHSDGPDLFPLDITVREEDFALDLTVLSGKPLVLQGERGLDPKGPEPGNASYYFSWTRLPVVGTVRSGDADHRVRGNAWFDREWSTSVLPDGVAGWDWFALQLDDGTDLMYYRLRTDGGGTAPDSGGVVIDRAGRVIRRLTPADVELEAQQTWRSPATDSSYPVSWRLVVPSESLDLDIVPRLPDQEMAHTVRYWEGAMQVTGRRDGLLISGVGYLEMAGR